jgi:hypothetical protein
MMCLFVLVETIAEPLAFVVRGSAPTADLLAQVRISAAE